MSTRDAPAAADDLRGRLEEIARGAGEILMRHDGGLSDSDVDFKGRRDLLTIADEESEAFILEQLRRHFPDHGILAEESGRHGGRDLESGVTWIVDPLDGTTNFVHGVPMFCVSLGVIEDGRPLAGCVYAPRLDELFLAQRGLGATLGGEPIRVSRTADLLDAMLATGFAYRVGELEQDNLDNFCHLIPKTRAIRRCGSAAIDLCYTACGRFDGFWELHLSEWDVAAGALIVREAGGLVTDLAGGDDWLFGANIVAANPDLHELLRAELRPFERSS